VAEAARTSEREGSAATCPYCRAELARGEPVLVCEGCAAAYHPECLRQLERCATLGCAGARAVPREYAPAARTAIRIEAEPGQRQASQPSRAGAVVCLVALAITLGVYLYSLPPGHSRATTAQFLLLVCVGTLPVILSLLGWTGADADRAPRVTPGPPPVPAAPVARGSLLEAAATRARSAQSACPCCGRRPRLRERVLVCEGCQARYHPDCLRAAGRCTTAGCAGTRATPAVVGLL
jgi:hypothetical protein